MIAAIIPVYNHPLKIENICKTILQETALKKIFLVNDGSNPECTTTLRKLAIDIPHITLIEHKRNSGKGAAVITGLIAAHKAGYTHAFQIDADGQHDLRAITEFILATQKSPNSIIVGYPKYDHTVPTGRLIGRYATHIWVWINTLSFQIKDSMCGFRIYPLTPTIEVIESTSLGKRMDFDTEILVKLCWKGLPFINLPVKVAYPTDGISHFRLWRDNLLISWMHTKLFFGMIIRLPKLLLRK
jgi:glycosyltransferase involved in cell wall biosynthesis